MEGNSAQGTEQRTHDDRVRYTNMKISVIIPTRNNAARIAGPLRALARQKLVDSQYELLVIDNGSTDNTATVLEQLHLEMPNLRWITEPTVGRSAARNRGIREATGDLIVFLDDDIFVEANHLERHVAYHLDTGDNMAVVGKVVDASPMKPAWLQDYFHVRQQAGSPKNRIGSDWRYFATGNVSLLLQTLENVRLEGEGPSVYFDPNFTVREDGELGFRLSKAGVRFILADDIICQHKHPRTTKEVLGRSYSIGYSTALLIDKHPETAVLSTQHLPASPPVKWGLLVACILLFCPAFLMRPVWPELLRRVTGAILQYQRIRGYQRARRDLQRKRS
jgi:glycosyltransferase involved in cell wall biosynthesis